MTFFLVLPSSLLKGSIRISDFCSTPPFGYVSDVSRHGGHDDNVSGRAANIPPFFSKFKNLQAGCLKPDCLTLEKQELVLHTLIETSLLTNFIPWILTNKNFLFYTVHTSQ